MARTADPALPGRILNAARALIAEDGPAALKARPLAAAAGCAVGGLYRAYPSLEHIGAALNAETLRAMLARLEAVSAEDPRRRILCVAVAYVAFARDAGALWRAVLELPRPPAGDAPSAFDDATTALLDFAYAAMAPLTGEADADRVSRIVWAGLHGLTQLEATNALNLPEGESADALAEQLVQTVLAGIAASAAG